MTPDGILSIDFETGSQADLKRTGAYAYAENQSTLVLCMAWAFDAEPVSVWRAGQPFPERVIEHVRSGGSVRGWNIMFEWCIWNLTLRRTIPELPALEIEQVHDTMAQGAVWGLPMSLDQAGLAIGASMVKDKAGSLLMKRMMRPRRVNPATGEAVWWHETDAAKFDRLCDYCAQDVDAERDIARRLPNMPAYERCVWLMDARMNLRGLQIDRQAVTSLEALADAEVRRLDARMWEVTGGKVATTTAIGPLALYANSFGFQNVGMAADTLGDLLADPALALHPSLLEALTLRKQARKTSTKKLKSMLEAVSSGDRIRGMFQYGGAGRTLRWAGRLVQPQNLPRPAKGIDPDKVIEAIRNGANAEVVGLIWGDTLDVIASCLRGCFVSAAGHLLVVFDFSAIEARVVAWLAGQRDILEVFARGEDVYVYTAAGIGSTDRQLGKVLVLACGYGMGPPKFQDTALTYGITLELADAETLVGAWRRANKHIVNFWYALDRAARDAINNPNAAFPVGDHITMRMGRNRMQGALLMELPSGRHIAYREARLEWEDGRETIVFMGVDQKTRQWVRQRTYGGKLAENATQAVARDLLADAKLRIEAKGLPLVGTVHDEVLTEPLSADASSAYAAIKDIMSTTPAWAKGLPLGGAGLIAARYGKG